MSQATTFPTFKTWQEAQNWASDEMERIDPEDELDIDDPQIAAIIEHRSREQSRIKAAEPKTAVDPVAMAIHKQEMAEQRRILARVKEMREERRTQKKAATCWECGGDMQGRHTCPRCGEENI